MPLIRRSSVAQEPPVPASAELGALLAELGSANAEARWTAARRLCAYPESAPALGAALAAETSAPVREAIFTSLGRLGEAGVDVLLPLLRSEDAALRCAAIDALQLSPHAVRPQLAALLADADADVRMLATGIARALPPGEATDLLIPLLEHEQEANVCAAAVEVLSECGSRAALEPLRRCAARFEESPFLIFAIEAALARISGED